PYFSRNRMTGHSQSIVMKRLLAITFSVILSSALALGESSTEVPDKDELKSMIEASLFSFGRAVKKEDFSEFYGETARLWQKQTTPEKLRDAFKDFLNKEIDLPAAIKG